MFFLYYFEAGTPNDGNKNFFGRFEERSYIRDNIFCIFPVREESYWLWLSEKGASCYFLALSFHG